MKSILFTKKFNIITLVIVTFVLLVELVYNGYLYFFFISSFSDYLFVTWLYFQVQFKKISNNSMFQMDN